MPDLVSEHNTFYVAIEQLIKQQCGYQVELIQKQRFQVYSDGSMTGNAVEVQCPSSSSNTATFTFTPPTMRMDGSILNPADIASYSFRVTFFNGFSGQVMVTLKDGVKSDWSVVVP